MSPLRSTNGSEGAVHWVTPNVGLLRAVHISNVWLLQDDDGRRFLIDTGYPVERPILSWSLRRQGIRGPGDLTAVLLTHRHSDHAGNAAWLRATFACPVVCHGDDAPILSGRTPRPRLARGLAPFYQEILLHIEDRFPAVCPVDDVYAEGSWRWGFRVIGTPGHTEGSVMLFHEPTGALFSGDSLLTGIAPLRWPEVLYFVLPGFSFDAARCRSAVEAFLEELPPVEALCAGHGPAVKDAVREKLLRLTRPTSA